MFLIVWYHYKCIEINFKEEYLPQYHLGLTVMNFIFVKNKYFIYI